MKVHELLSHLERYPAGATVSLQVNYRFAKEIAKNAIDDYGVSDDEIVLQFDIDSAPIEAKDMSVVLETKHGSSGYNWHNREKRDVSPCGGNHQYAMPAVRR